MDTVKVARMLYKNKDEYMSEEGVYSMNHVLGCTNGCRYLCYAYQSAKYFGRDKSYEDWCEPNLVGNTLELLGKELSAKRREPVKRVYMCPSTDPFPYQEGLTGYRFWDDFETKGRSALIRSIKKMSTDAIRLINAYGIPVTVLTKGILPEALGDPCARYEGVGGDWLPTNELGISLVSLDERFRERWEPGSAPYFDRVEALRALHKAGCRTWVSISPWPSPAVIAPFETMAGDDAAKAESYGETVTEVHSWLRSFRALDELLREVRFVDKIVFGKRSHSFGRTDSDYYRACAGNVMGFCERHGIEFHMNAGTVAETPSEGR